MSEHVDPHRVYETLANLIGMRENVKIGIVSIRPKPPDADGEPPGERRPEEASA